MDNIFSSPGQISKVTTLADGTVRIQFDSQELNSQGMSSLFQLFNQYGSMIFALPETPIEEIGKVEIPQVIPAKKSKKSKSVQLRETMWLFWKQSGSSGDFDDYYNNQMDRLIDYWRKLLT